MSDNTLSFHRPTQGTVSLTTPEPHTLLTPKYRVGVDLDGVCYNFVAAFRSYLITQGWKAEQMPEACCWDFPVNHWGMTWPSFADLMHEATDAGHLFVVGDPYPKVIESLRRIQAAGHEIHVITDRSWGKDNRAHDSTREWLERVMFPHDSLTFSADKNEVPTDFFIEDRDKNFLALVDAGVNAYLMDRPYNRHVDTPNRVADMEEYADAVLAA